MAKPSKRELGYRNKAEKVDWPDIASTWKEIKGGRTPGWEPGKALEYVIVRAFRLSRLDADYPYDVPPGGQRVEQIDGIVYLDGLAFLLECKDQDRVDIEAFAKLRNQLMRRPDTAMGCLFVADEFTMPALTLADYSVPHRIILWPGADIESAIAAKDFAGALRDKYRGLCKHGLTDHSPTYRALEV